MWMRIATIRLRGRGSPGGSSRRTIKHDAVATTIPGTIGLTTAKDHLATRLTSIGWFPWRQAPKDEELPTWRWLSMLYVSLVLGFRKAAEKPSFTIPDIIDGSRAAFQCATDGIFMHHLMQLHKQQLLSAGKKPAVSNSTDNAPIEPPMRLQDMFAPDLASFYQYAIEQHCVKANRMCNYSLESVNSVRIHDLQWYNGAPKSNEGIQAVRFLPGYNIFKLAGAAKDAISDLKPENTSHLERYIDVHKVLLRVAVDVECTETFAITDVESGEVVQGELSPRIATHQLLLEGIFNRHDFSSSTGWMIADIDNWLEGNQYWIKDHLHPPSTTTGTTTGTSQSRTHHAAASSPDSRPGSTDNNR